MPGLVGPAARAHDHHAPLAPRGVHGVQQQVHERLLEGVGPAEDGRQARGQIERRLDAFQRPLRLEQVVRGAHHQRDIHGLQPLLAGLGIVEEAAHDGVDALELARKPGHYFGVGPFPAAAQHFQVGADGTQGIPHLVRHPGGEPAHTGQFLAAHELALGVE